MRTSVSLEKKTLPILSSFNQAGFFEIPSAPEEQALSWKQKLERAFKNDTDSGLQVIQNVLQNAAPENKNKYLEQMAELFTENPALLNSIVHLLVPSVMSAKELDDMFEYMDYNESENAFSLLHS